MSASMTRTKRKALSILAALAGYVVVACAISRPGAGPQNGWWEGNGPVVPHDSFPADCSLCHEGRSWRELRADFTFDHEAETGVALTGSHLFAKCLRCHNDRGPVATFVAKGCAGCHEDVHVGQLGQQCLECHDEVSWVPHGAFELHFRTRFPLVGVHAVVPCWRCHVGAEVGRFVPTDPQCVTCHRDDLNAAKNPNHIALNWVDRCNRCHRPTDWSDAEFD